MNEELRIVETIYDALHAPCPECGGVMQIESEDGDNALICGDCQHLIALWSDGFFTTPQMAVAPTPPRA